MTGSESDAPGLARPELVRVLESAARLQEVVPDAVLVGGSAAALWANHRFSHDHDHVLHDLSDRFDAVLEAIEATDGWVTNRVTPGKIILVLQLLFHVECLSAACSVTAWYAADVTVRNGSGRLLRRDGRATRGGRGSFLDFVRKQDTTPRPRWPA